MPEILVKSALLGEEKKNKKERTPVGKTTNYLLYATDVDRPHFEVLYKYGPQELNRMIRHWGLKYTAIYVGLSLSQLCGLKEHFGRHRQFPSDSIEKLAYFSKELRKKVDERDNKKCQRCGRKTDRKNRRYHKIYHPGPMTIDNCITLCYICRKYRILKHGGINGQKFKGMTYDELKKWIQENDPPMRRKSREEKAWKYH
jgi:hypothetical protein